MNPAVALVLVVVYGVGVALMQSLSLAMVLPLVWLGVYQRHALGRMFKTLALVNVLVAVVVISLVLQGAHAWALLVAVRSNCVIAFALLCFDQKDASAIARGMQQLRLPHVLVSMVFFTAKFIELLRREFVQFKNTAKVRGFVPKTTLLTYRTVAGFVGMLIIKAFERAGQLQHTMKIRQFQGRIYTLEATPRPTLGEWGLLGMSVVSVGLYVGGWL